MKTKFPDNVDRKVYSILEAIGAMTSRENLEICWKTVNNFSSFNNSKNNTNLMLIFSQEAVKDTNKSTKDYSDKQPNKLD